MSQNWNKRYRDNMEKMKSGSIYEVAGVVRNLSFKQKKKKDFQQVKRKCFLMQNKF